MLGDTIQQALSLVGVTQDRVSRWLGDCCCQERKEKLNQLDLWARRTLRNKLNNATEYLSRILEGQ